ncbi:MAG: hypothetical protein WC089_01795 [Candidatus Paceibacterota bacterium]
MYQKLNITDIAAIITAFSTVVYTVGTFLLWKISQRSLQNAQLQIELQRQFIEANFISSIYKNFRELYSSIIKDKHDIKILSDAKKSDPDTVREEYLGSFLINHAYEIYSLNQKKLIPLELWERVVIDMKVLFKWSFVKKRWGKIRKLYPLHFQSFIDDSLIDYEE